MKVSAKLGVLIGSAVVLIIGVVVLVLLLPKKQTAPAAGAPDVEVVQVQQQDVSVYSEWIGTTDGMVNAEIRAQVSGYLLKQDYHEGSFVRKGQLLFEIDPRPLQAVVDQAKGELAKAQGQLSQANAQLSQSQANLGQAEANQAKAQADVDRYTPLAREKAITREQLDNAVQANRGAIAAVKAAGAGVETAKAGIAAAKAAVTSSEAAVHTAELNLAFTKIISPIDGIAGIAQAQVGNLVNPNSGPITIVSTVNPIRVWFSMSEQEYLNFAKDSLSHKDWEAANKRLELELILADGSTYPQRGRYFMADREMDPKTGSIRLAGIFPNPGDSLRPGQYGRVRAVTSTKEGALLVPQRAVTEMQGSYQVAVVGGDNKISLRPVKVGERVDSNWVIEDGLKPGERVVAEGTQKVKPGMVVNAKPFSGAAPEKKAG
jgi:membrane fusion protein (multidrug efflux system)